MQFRTQIPISKSNYPIDYNSRIISLGSCFAENITDKLNYFKFQNDANPFGIIFNSASLEKIITRIVQKDIFTEKDIFFHNERWNCYEVHSDLSNSNKIEFLQNLNTVLKRTNQQITQSTHIIITLGTAWVYKNIENEQIVANCYKVSQKQFIKELLSIKAIQENLESIISLISSINKATKFIFTISPVRHIKDGFVENTLSKAHLINALHSFIRNNPTTSYFPSYEILMDELRDYRFYNPDMLHPNQTAIDYIWEHFLESYMDREEFPVMQQVSEIQKALNHKPFNIESQNHQQFLSKLQDKIMILEQRFPQIKF
ncbi:MAG: GSCFA domain-containing protein [Flavobacterium sp.]|uniref:GSCFA domain-containing protein n=1 Tax=Flavobacterium sp. TaxID=239 RepID=UPI0032642153